jgi:starch synthase
MRRAHAAWRDPETWRVLQRNGMARDFDWREAALRYCDLYRAAAASVASL